MKPGRCLSRLVLVVALLLALPASAQAQQQSSLAPALRDWIHMEQAVNLRGGDPTRLAPLVNRQNPAYAPEAQQTFTVESYWVDAGDAHLFTASQAEPWLRDTFVRQVNGRTQVRLIVHPESRSFYASVTAHAERAEDFEATATASSRTLLVWRPGQQDRPFFAKVSLNSEIGGVVRTIPAGEVARSVGTSELLSHEENLPAGFRVLPEVIGVMPRGMPRGGMIIRQIPRDIATGRVRYVPMFSLYARRPDGRAPMLVDMIHRSGLSPHEFVRRNIVQPFVRQWLSMVVEHGITMEPHPQNVLMELDRDGNPTGNFLHRDFGGFNLDFAHRARLGLGARPANLPTMGDINREYHLDETESRLGNLDTYFRADFLYNLDQEMPGWFARGELAGERPGAGAFQQMVVHELDAQVSAMIGRPAGVDGRAANMASAMRAARAHVLAQRANTAATRANAGAASAGDAHEAVAASQAREPGAHPQQARGTSGSANRAGTRLRANVSATRLRFGAVQRQRMGTLGNRGLRPGVARGLFNPSRRSP